MLGKTSFKATSGTSVQLHKKPWEVRVANFMTDQAGHAEHIADAPAECRREDPEASKRSFKDRDG